MKKLIKNKAIRTASVLVSSALALALASPSYASVPTTDHTGIHLPDDGNWYEVQWADSYITLCEGLLHCGLRSGVFNVINHSTGERFENLVVAGRPQSSAIAPVYEVRDNTILAWYDGDYEIQNRATGQVACAGRGEIFNALECDLDNGIYNIIRNLDDGSVLRYDNVPVPTPYNIEYDELGLEQSINFTVPGWFQVQSAFTYATLCEGSASIAEPLVCDVDSGKYNLIYISNDTAETPTLLEYGATIRIDGVDVF